MKALRSLSVFSLLQGFRGQDAADVDAIVEAVQALAEFAESNRDRLMELDINPLLVLPNGCGVVAVDALMSFLPEES